MNGLIFTGFLNLQPPTLFADPEREAWRHLRKAVYYELELDRVADRLERRYVTKPMRKYAPYLGVAIRIAAERQVSYTWTF